MMSSLRDKLAQQVYFSVHLWPLVLKKIKLIVHKQDYFLIKLCFKRQSA